MASQQQIPLSSNSYLTTNMKDNSTFHICPGSKNDILETVRQFVCSNNNPIQGRYIRTLVINPLDRHDVEFLSGILSYDINIETLCIKCSSVGRSEVPDAVDIKLPEDGVCHSWIKTIVCDATAIKNLPNKQRTLCTDILAQLYARYNNCTIVGDKFIEPCLARSDDYTDVNSHVWKREMYDRVRIHYNADEDITICYSIIMDIVATWQEINNHRYDGVDRTEMVSSLLLDILELSVFAAAEDLICSTHILMLRETLRPENTREMITRIKDELIIRILDNFDIYAFLDIPSPLDVGKYDNV